MELDVDVAARVTALLEDSQTARRRAEDRRMMCLRDFSQLPLAFPPMVLAGGAGTLDMPDSLAAKTGFYWSVRRLTAVGWSAGSVTVFADSVVGEPLAPFPAPAVLTFGRGELLLNPGSRLVVSATGITGSVQLWGKADCFPTWMLARYMGVE